jgi:hypothetical protein
MTPVSPDHDVDFHMEEGGLRRLHLDHYSSRPDRHSSSIPAGQKRRASSPPVEDGPSLHTVGSASDLFGRRESSGTSPVPRFHSTSESVSLTAPGLRSSSYASNLSVAASSIKSKNSYGTLSPGGISPGSSTRQATRPRRAQRADETNAEYKLAIEASKWHTVDGHTSSQSATMPPLARKLGRSRSPPSVAKPESRRSRSPLGRGSGSPAPDSAKKAGLDPTVATGE